MKIIAYVAIALLGLQCTQAAAADACASQIPPTLKSVLDKTYPDYRPPLATDNSKEDVSYDLEHGGKGCLRYASADFNGDGKVDAVVSLAAKKGNASIIVAAISTGSTWTIHELQRWKDGRGIYVATGKPDRYDRVESLDGPLERGESQSLVCPYSVAIFGGIEASGVAYCLQLGSWQHVWISD
jgi:hypothetical protein